MARPDDRRPRGAWSAPRSANDDANASSHPHGITGVAERASTLVLPLWEVVPEGRFASVTFDCREQWIPECRLWLVGETISDFTARGGECAWGHAEVWSDRVPVDGLDELHGRLMWLWSHPCDEAAA